MLALLAGCIWLRDINWSSTSEDTLPILMALPLFVWLGWPWQFNEKPKELSTSLILSSALLWLLGITLNITLLLALGWTLLLWTWLATRIAPQSYARTKKLLVLPLMAFPWISLDAGQLGWWFRLSGAWITGQFFSLLGLDVSQEGTQLLINHLPISVEVACAGLNTLQSMLIAGSALAFLLLGETNLYWINLAVIVGMAWIANTLRIIIISFVGLWLGAETAMGVFHTWGGWVVIVLMFGLCYAVFHLQAPQTTTEGSKKL